MVLLERLGISEDVALEGLRCLVILDVLLGCSMQILCLV